MIHVHEEENGGIFAVYIQRPELCIKSMDKSYKHKDQKKQITEDYIWYNSHKLKTCKAMLCITSTYTYEQFKRDL